MLTRTQETELRDRIRNLEMDLKESQYEEWERGKEIVLLEALFKAHRDTLTEGYVEVVGKVFKKFDRRCIQPSKDPVRPLDRRAWKKVYRLGFDRGKRHAGTKIRGKYMLTLKKGAKIIQENI